MSFQSQVNTQPAPACAGDFASANPRSTVLAGPGGLVAGPLGVTVGKFAWVDPASPSVANNYGSSASGAPTGFVHREQQALITAFLANSGNLVPAGMPVSLNNAGDFWARNAGAAASIGDTVYAGYADGGIYNAAPGAASFTASIGGVVTASIGASFTATGSGTNLTTSAQTGVLHVGDIVTGTGVPANTTIVSQTSGVAGAAGVYVTSNATTSSGASLTSTSTVLDVTAITSGTIQPTDAISGANVTVGSTVTSQISGTTGGVGTYRMSGVAQAAASTAVTSLSTVLVVTAVASGTLAVGDPIAGGATASGSVITGLGSGVGLAGTYVLNKASTVVSGTITTTAGVATAWKVKSAGATGELIKISTWG